MVGQVDVTSGGDVGVVVGATVAVGMGVDVDWGPAAELAPPHPARDTITRMSTRKRPIPIARWRVVMAYMPSPPRSSFLVTRRDATPLQQREV
jgi:hypothetical protein